VAPCARRNARRRDRGGGRVRLQPDRLGKAVALAIGVALLIAVLWVLVQFLLGFLAGLFGG
jgi:hypothetical protein